MTQSLNVKGSSFRMGLFLSGWLDPGAPSAKALIDTLLGRVVAAEQAGFTSVWVGQHLLGDPWPVLDTSVFLGRISGATETLEIGGVYLLPLSHPIRLAESLMSLDNISGGRFNLCAALGWAPREFAAIGIPIRERVKRFEEIITVIRHLWSSAEPLNFNGKYYSFDRVNMVSRSERPGGIPIWIGASSEVGVRRAAQLGDAWLGSSHTPFEDLASFSKCFDTTLATEGRVVQRRPLLRHCIVAATDELATQRFVNAFEAYYRALGDWGIFKEVVGERHSIDSSACRLPPGRAVVGSPETVIRQIAEYQRLGFNEIVFQVGLPGTPERFVHESLELLGYEVLPRLVDTQTAPAMSGLVTREDSNGPCQKPFDGTPNPTSPADTAFATCPVPRLGTSPKA
ncbi:LLM class flavin-dependent oxidoreductase [Rhodococcus pseudokoreensis]|uniref:LLM class flavin-dependent oxidoreductase n=1 Tax=Rhodococcus pseudokoreensis TaxID=2811421 RepID=A0A974W845_9NOCA|nr:LLM class flavin-dependent oxidoreductase [Rhodococcus pseudokoreensis]QSE93014.1 LLM class flavin-dependent oxidoreductase [Rhodococcus pseudokoreensis]